MKQLQKSDLKEGDIYVSDLFYDGSYTYLNKHSLSERGFGLNLTFKNDFRSDWILSYRNIREATPEEKHWLKECIKADNFVSYEKAMKTFVPEYVEWINNIGSDNLGYQTKDHFKKNKIFKTDVELPSHGFQTQDWITHLKIYPNNYKSSTKEAYEAQFKEPEFVLPEIWWVRITKENLEDVCKFLSFTPYEKAIGYITGMVKHYCTGKVEKGWNATPTTVYGSTFGDEITTEQFRKYVLKEEPVVYEEPKDTVLQLNQIRGKGTTIVQVQCSEGGIYKIGDKITVFDKTSPNKGKPFTITGFRWNNAKTEICVGTELHKPYGIRLSKIELYVEPKVEAKQELSLLEQAKLKYPVGTKYIPTLRSLSKISEVSNGLFIETPNFILNAVNSTSLYNKNTKKWAEIVENFVLPEKWCIRLNLENVNIVGKWFNENSQTGIYDYHKLTLDRVITVYNILHYPAYNYLGLKKHGSVVDKIENGYTEITFEQFKKYVLNEKV